MLWSYHGNPRLHLIKWVSSIITCKKCICDHIHFVMWRREDRRRGKKNWTHVVLPNNLHINLGNTCIVSYSLEVGQPCGREQTNLKFWGKSIYPIEFKPRTLIQIKALTCMKSPVEVTYSSSKHFWVNGHFWVNKDSAIWANRHYPSLSSM